MISGKIILKSATKLTLDKRFSEIAKQAPPVQAAPRIQQQANVIIPYSRQELFGNKRPAAALSIAARLKKRSINYRLGLGPTGTVNRQQYVQPSKPRVFQRISLPNRRRGGMIGGGANAYLFGGQSGMGVRLRGQGRIGTTRTFRSRTRGYLNNNAISRSSGNTAPRGNRNQPNRGRRMVGNKNFNRPNRGRGGPNNNNRGRGNRRINNNTNTNNRNNNNANRNVTKESLDTDLDKYMAQSRLDNDANEMDAI